MRIDSLPRSSQLGLPRLRKLTGFWRFGAKCYVAVNEMAKIGSALVMAVAVLGGAGEVWAVDWGECQRSEVSNLQPDRPVAVDQSMVV